MKFLVKTSFGLLALCSFVCSMGDVDAKNNTNVLSPVNTTETKSETKEVPTRTPDLSSSIPPLEHTAGQETPADPSLKLSPQNPDQKPSEKPITDKPVQEKSKENEKNSASSLIQMYPLALTSVAVLLFSAI